MKNLEIIVTEDGRIEMTIDGDPGTEPFLLETKAETEVGRLRELLDLATRVYAARGVCRLTMGEVDETA